MANTAPLVGELSNLIGQAEKQNQRKVTKELGKDAFLQLLVSQLKNQDPMKPMEDTDFIAQMAQFSSLEQMQNLNKVMEKQQNFAALSQAAGMIGKEVAVDIGEGLAARGEVSEVRHVDGKIVVVLGGKEYDAGDIIQVKEKSAGAAES